MDNLYGMSLLSVSTLSELHIFQKQNGYPAIRELKRSDAMPDNAIRERLCDLFLQKEWRETNV
jgi:hypothetical protein